MWIKPLYGFEGLESDQPDQAVSLRRLRSTGKRTHGFTLFSIVEYRLKSPFNLYKTENYLGVGDYALYKWNITAMVHKISDEY